MRMQYIHTTDNALWVANVSLTLQQKANLERVQKEKHDLEEYSEYLPETKKDFNTLGELGDEEMELERQLTQLKRQDTRDHSLGYRERSFR